MSSSRKPSGADRDEALELAAQVLRGERSHSDLEAHGVELRAVAHGQEGKELLLSELAEVESAASKAKALWEDLVAHGAIRARRARLDALFSAPDAERATALAAAFTANWGAEGWTVRTDASGDTGVRVTVTTRAIVLGLETIEVLANEMLDAERTHGCVFERLVLAAAPPQKPWWKFW